MQPRLTAVFRASKFLPVHCFSRSRASTVIEHMLVFAGDLLPYGVIFVLTMAVGYGMGLESAGSLSLALAYVSVTTALVCGPNLLSLRRRMPDAASPGAVVAAAIGLRTTVIVIGALIVIGGLSTAGPQPGMISLIALLFLGRLFETAVDGPATSVQYRRGAFDYFFLRFLVFSLVVGITIVGVLNAGKFGMKGIVWCYVLGSATGLLFAYYRARGLLLPVSGLGAEWRAQVADFAKFFAATALFLAASRLHPMIISYVSGHEAAGQFAMVQNLFSAVALVATGVAGVFFWSRNRKGSAHKLAGMPWRWFAGALPGGLTLGIAGGVVMDYLYLRPLGSSTELRSVAWILCLSTPLLLVQSILSNTLVLQRRDREMLKLATANAVLGLLVVFSLVYYFGLMGAALSVGCSALLSSLVGVYFFRRTNE